MDKVYVKKMVTRGVFLGVGLHLIYKFYEYTNLKEHLNKIFEDKEE